MIVTPQEIVISIEEWECYSDTPQGVVDKINAEFRVVLNTNTSPSWAQKRFFSFLDTFANYGFRDSECCQVATDVINRYYCSSIDRWEHLFIDL